MMEGVFMGDNIVEKYVLCNNNSISVDDFDSSLTLSFPGVYEVIRIIDGVPLFLENHMERFRSSSRLLGYELGYADESIESSIKELVKLNGCTVGNIKIVINNLDKAHQDSYMYFIASKYPSRLEIESGVPVILYHAERSNPNAKSTNLSYREGLNAEISKHNAYEALLVNKKNEITEGSKSNVFFVRNQTIYTSPLVNVLPGVTRGKVMEICEKMGLNLVETAISVDFLKEIDGLFITGTSPQVLPVSSVDGIKYSSSSNTIITDIRKSYEHLVEEYIKSRR